MNSYRIVFTSSIFTHNIELIVKRLSTIMWYKTMELNPGTICCVVIIYCVHDYWDMLIGVSQMYQYFIHFSIWSNSAIVMQ